MANQYKERSASTWDNETLLRRNQEIMLVWNYLRKEKSHTADWCRKFIHTNYFISPNYIYKILVATDLHLEAFDADQASVIYHHVIDNY
ncbi:MAG: hypothetical protein RIC30_09470 [Marinoscillum sp.]|uniref:hypothetical protein n=1 Tax=Marinoscillum sp. TaxID=2024838 RepID=UPI0032F9B90A